MRISIVTPTLNRAHFLAEAIESVLAQGVDDVEHIVVDGMSTDGTVDLLARYPHLRVIREPDTGLYDAINKGLRVATGEIIGLLNSDDLYPPDTFQRVREAASDPAIEAVYGRAEVFSQAAGDAVPKPLTTARRLSAQSPELTFTNVMMGAPNPNARFFRRSIYDRAGFFESRYRIAADRDFLLRVALVNPRAAILDGIVYRYRWHGESLTFSEDPSSRQKVRSEYMDIAERFLKRTDLPPGSEAILRAWHTRESSSEVHAAMLRLDWRAMGANVRRGWRFDAGWPLACFRTGFRGLVERAGFGQTS